MTDMTTLGSSMVASFENAYRAVRESNPDLPENVIFLLADGAGRNSVRYGHYDGDRWQLREDGAEGPQRAHEIMISGQCIAKGARQVLQTIIHESAHALAGVRGIQDTSRGDRVHNRKFVALAEELGLEWPTQPDGRRQNADKSIGFSAVVLTDRTADDYHLEIGEIHRAITAAIDGGLVDDSGPEAKPMRVVLIVTFAKDGDEVEMSPKMYEKIGSHLLDHVTRGEER